MVRARPVAAPSPRGPCRPSTATALRCRAALQHNQEQQQPPPGEHPRRLARLAACGLAAAACSVLAVLQPWPNSAARADELSIAFPASADPEIRAAQKTLVESWAYVDTLYVDPDNSHTTWAKALQDALAASFKAGSAAEVNGITRDLLASLGDPYTKLLQGRETDALVAEQEGKIVATGLGLQPLQLQPDGPDEQQQQQQQLMVVSFVVQDSAAAAAGVQEGDVLLSLAGQPVGDKDLRSIYRLLDQEVDASLARQPQLPGLGSSNASGGGGDGVAAGSSASVAGSGAEGVLQGAEVYAVRLKPTPLEFEPVQYGVIDLGRLSTGGADAPAVGSASTDAAVMDTIATTTTSSSAGSRSDTAGAKVGYLKLLTFSATAPKEVAEALRDMQQEQQQGGSSSGGGGGLAGLVLDLRDNPGGIVEAGVDIAQDFLHEGQTLCIAADKSGVEEQVVLPEAHTLTELPLAVLINHSTASTSELLAGALRDELRAPLIGTTTYGKGRSQRVLPLSDGASTLLVSTLRYYTPRHGAIDGAGLAPDVACDPAAVVGQQWQGGRVGGEEGDEGAASLLDDPCIRMAAERLAAGG